MKDKRVQIKIREIVDTYFSNSNECIGFTGTFKTYGRFGRVNQDIVIRNNRNMMNFLNYKIYKNKFRRNKLGVKNFIVIEGGEKKYDKELHIHTIFELPPSNIISKTDFVRNLKQSFHKTYYANILKHINSSIDQGWNEYITKFIFPCDEPDWQNSNYLI